MVPLDETSIWVDGLSKVDGLPWPCTRPKEEESSLWPISVFEPGYLFSCSNVGLFSTVWNQPLALLYLRLQIMDSSACELCQPVSFPHRNPLHMSRQCPYSQMSSWFSCSVEDWCVSKRIPSWTEGNFLDGFSVFKPTKTGTPSICTWQECVL